VIHFADVVRERMPAMWFAGGYPNKEHLEAALPIDRKAPDVLIVQDLFETRLSSSAKIVLPATASFEKDGMFVSHAGLAQTFPRATRPPVEVRTELQIAHDLLGRKGLVQAANVREEMGGAPIGGLLMPSFDSMNLAIVIVGLMGGVLGIVGYLTLAERKVSAWIQDRIGPNRVGPGGLLQPLADGGKFFLKEEVMPKHVDKVFYLLAPAVAVITALMAIAVVPFWFDDHATDSAAVSRGI